MKPHIDLSDPLGMIKQGLKNLEDTKRQAHRHKLDILARFEKAAAWTSDAWTHWDFEEAPEELAQLEAANLSYKDVCRRCETWLQKNEGSKSDLIRLIERRGGKPILDEVKTLIDAGADLNAASLLKDTALSAARYHDKQDVFDYLIQNGADGTKCGFSELHHAVRYGGLSDVTSLIGSFDILRHGDGNTSVLNEAVIAGKPDILAALLDRISAEGRIGEDEVADCCNLAVSLGSSEMVVPFLDRGVDANVGLDATLLSYDVELLRALLAQGADIHEISDIALYHEDPLKVRDANGEPAIAAFVRTLLDEGWSIDDLDKFERDQIRFVTEAYRIPEQNIMAPNFLDGATKHEGRQNPEQRTSPYHLEMLRTGESTFSARRRMVDLPNGAWTADRFGQTTTRLPDGRWVQIGGEHEDFYDPDFVIFNDVVLHGPNTEPRLFFYPESVFPPTDFHSASLLGDTIWIIGGLGYQGRRQLGMTPVYRLSLTDFQIRQVQTTGQAPGWISNHSAATHGKVIAISGGKISHGSTLSDLDGSYEFDTESCNWTASA